MFSIKTKSNNPNLNRGQVMLILVIFFMIFSSIIILGVINPTIRNIKVASDLFNSKRSLFLSDSGVTDAVYRIKANMNISDQEILTIDNNTATTNILDTIEGKTIRVTADYLDYIRNIEVKIIKGVGVSFFYGVQTGEGGFILGGNSQVNGNIYSNGSISGGTVTGSVISATTTGSISGVEVGSLGVGDAHAHIVKDSNVAGALKCKVDDLSNNKLCDTSFADPSPIDMPVSDEQINEWKTEAETEGVINGNYSPDDDVSLGPVKITGNFNVKKKVTMTGTIWVQGTLSFSGGNAKIVLATSTYGNKSGVIIVDKYTTFSGGSQIMSTGEPGSYVMLLVTSDCPVSSFCSGQNAISASGNAGSVILAAPYGTISFSGNSTAKGVIANKIVMGGNTSINYEFGLADLNFVSGPTGAYQVISFRETE